MIHIDEHFVYLIAHAGEANGNPRGPIKVGFSKYPDKRLLALQTGNPRRLEIVFMFRTPSRDLALYSERVFHEVCAKDRLAGEWFDQSPVAALVTLIKCFFASVTDDIPDSENASTMLEWCGLDKALSTFGNLIKREEVPQ